MRLEFCLGGVSWTRRGGGWGGGVGWGGGGGGGWGGGGGGVWGGGGGGGGVGGFWVCGVWFCLLDSPEINFNQKTLSSLWDFLHDHPLRSVSLTRWEQGFKVLKFNESLL